MVTNPLKMSNLFNQYFRNKVETLREKTNNPPTIPPTERLGRWLAKRDNPPPPFQFHAVDKDMFRKIM